MAFYLIIIKKTRKANRKYLQCHKEQVDFKGVYTKLHDNFVLEGLSQQLVVKFGWQHRLWPHTSSTSIVRQILIFDDEEY